MNKQIISINTTQPFHFDGTFHKPSHFPDRLSDWEPGEYWQTIWIGKKVFGIKIVDKSPDLELTIFSDDGISKEVAEKIKSEIIWRFGLDQDLSEFNELAKKDKRFYPIFKKWLGMRNSSAHNLYQLLIIAIVLQNATVRRSVQMLDVLLNNYGSSIEFDNRKLWAIWPPERLNNVPEQELRDLKIGYRAKFIKKLSEDCAKGVIDEEKLRKMSKEEAEKELVKLYGVGPETARILLFEALHHFDTFKHIAPWQQKIYSKLFYNKDLVPVDQIRDDIIKTYGQKYAMLAVHYIWEDIFWRRKNEHIDWLEKEIRL